MYSLSYAFQGSNHNMSSTEASMAGQVCLVTGASRGIGKGIATMLSKAGATVYVTGSHYKL